MAGLEFPIQSVSSSVRSCLLADVALEGRVEAITCPRPTRSLPVVGEVARWPAVGLILLCPSSTAYSVMVVYPFHYSGL